MWLSLESGRGRFEAVGCQQVLFIYLRLIRNISRKHAAVVVEDEKRGRIATNMFSLKHYVRCINYNRECERDFDLNGKRYPNLSPHIMLSFPQLRYFFYDHDNCLLKRQQIRAANNIQTTDERARVCLCCWIYYTFKALFCVHVIYTFFYYYWLYANASFIYIYI